MKLLVLGSKEYPMGTSDDSIKSGGIEIYIQNLVEHLKDRTEKIIIITRKFRKTESFEKRGSIEIYRVPWIRGFYLRNPSFNFLSFIKALTLSRDAFDVIFTKGIIAATFGVLLSKIKGKKIISCPAGIGYKQPQYSIVTNTVLGFLERNIYKYADVVVFLSQNEREEFQKKLGYTPKENVVIPTGVKVEKIPEDKIASIKNEFDLKNNVITFVGRLIGVKGVDILISAVKDLRADFKVLLVGDGPDRKRLEKLVKELDLENKIVFTGWRDDVPIILAASDIFVLPSYSEGLPIALLEAMAAGKACIVTDVGLPVKNKEDSLVVKAGDAKELKNAAETLIGDKALRERLGNASKKKAIEEFSWETAADSYIKLFEKSLLKTAKTSKNA